MRYDLAAIVSNFQIYGHFLGAEPYGSGHINDTKLNNVMIDNETQVLARQTVHRAWTQICLQAAAVYLSS